MLDVTTNGLLGKMMAKPAKERQQRWKDRQTAKGKKSVNVMVSAEIKEMIDREKASTGKTIAEIIERAVREHLRNSPSNKRRIDIDPANLTQTQKNALKALRSKHSRSPLTHSWIASSHNRLKIETLSGAEKWDEEEVQAALDYIDEHNLRWSLE